MMVISLEIPRILATGRKNVTTQSQKVEYNSKLLIIKADGL